MNTSTPDQSEEIANKVNALLETTKAAMDANIQTSAAATALAQRLTSAAESFNTDLGVVLSAMENFEAGKYTKDKATLVMKPGIESLKNNCIALGISDASSGVNDIAEEEIAILRGVIMGSKALADAKASELVALEATGGDTDGSDDEDEEDPEDGEDDGLEPASESAVNRKAAAYLKSTPVRTANELVKDAKKLYSYGSKEKAISYMTKAKSTYEKALEEVKKDRAFRKATVVNAAVAGAPWNAYANANVEKKSITDTYSMSAAVHALENKIDNCEAYLLQWQNKAGNKIFKETKDMLKAERIAERKRNRDNRKGANEAMNTMEQNIDELDAVDALESFMAFDFPEATEETEDLATESASNDVEEALAAMEAAVADLPTDEPATESIDGIDAELDALLG